MNIIMQILQNIILSILLTTLQINTAISLEIPQEQCPSSYYLCENDDEDEVCESNLRPMTFDTGYGKETALVYVTPDVSSFYNDGVKRELKKPDFDGFGIKVINMSPDPVTWWWYSGEDSEPMYMDTINPFEADGTSSFDGHVFYFTPTDDSSFVLKWFYIEEGTHLYYYDAFVVDSDDYEDDDDVPEEERTPDNDIEDLDEDELELYNRQKTNLKFAKEYRAFTGREWMSLYPRPSPRFKMWRADYFGQMHWVVTKETHFVSMPSDEELTMNSYISSKLNDTQPRLLHQYRKKQSMNMTMEVLSCAPRVFKIDHFLSDTEVKHILDLADKMQLSRSTTGDGTEQSVRTSKNTWLDREQSVIIDSIYRRAADLLLIDEALLRPRTDEFPDWPSQGTIAESLQLVHYNVHEEYTPHHDAGTPSIHAPHQIDRFATLLLYLNEGMVGGETSFPRYMNAETGEALKVTPKIGQAILFYDYLPDGNFDDLAQHAAEPVIDGEKWITNLWLWEPYRD